MSKQQKMQDEITKTLTALLKDNKPILPFIKEHRKETKHIFSLIIDTADTNTLQYYYDILPENIYHIKEYAQTLSKILSKKQQKTEDSNFSIKNLVSNMRAVILKNKRINDDGHISALFVELSYHNKDYKQYEYLEYAYQWLSYTNKLPNKSTLRKYFIILAGLFLKNHMFANYLNCIYRIHMLAKFNVNINFIRRVSKIVSYKNEKASKYFIGLSYKSAAEIVEYFEKDERKSMKEEEKIKHNDKDEETKNEEKNSDNKRTSKDEAENMEDDFDNEADFAREDNVCEDNTKQSMSHLLEFDFTYYDMLENGFNELDVKFISFLNLNNFTYKIEEDKVVDIKNEDRSLTTRIYDIIEEMRSKQKKNAIVEEVKEEKKEKKIKVQPVIKKKAKPKKKKNNYFDKEYNLFRMHSRNLLDFVPDQQDTHFEGRVEKANKLYNKEMEELIFVKNMVESAGDLEEMMKVISLKIEKENEERMKMKTESMREGTSVGGFRRGTKMGVINVESKGTSDVYDPSKSRTQERFRNTGMYDNNESRGQRSYEQKPGYSRDQSINEISQGSTEGARKFVRGQRSNEFGSTEIHDIQRSVRDLKLDETHKIGREQASSEPTNIKSEETKFVRGSKLQANIDSGNVQSERTMEKKAFVRGSQMNNFREDDRSRQMDAPPAREAYTRRTTDFDSNYGAERQSRGDSVRSYTRGSKVNEERPEYTSSRAYYRSNNGNETTISDREQNYNTNRENANEPRTRQPFVRGSKINSTTERESFSDRRSDNRNRNASNNRKFFDDERTNASDRWRGNAQASNFERGSKLTTSQRSETTQGHNNEGHTPRNSYRGRSNERDGKKDHENTSPVSDRKNSLGNTDDKKSTDDSSKGSFKGSFKRGSKFNN